MVKLKHIIKQSSGSFTVIQKDYKENIEDLSINFDKITYIEKGLWNQKFHFLNRITPNMYHSH